MDKKKKNETERQLTFDDFMSQSKENTEASTEAPKRKVGRPKKVKTVSEESIEKELGKSLHEKTVVNSIAKNKSEKSDIENDVFASGDTEESGIGTFSCDTDKSSIEKAMSKSKNQSKNVKIANKDITEADKELASEVMDDATKLQLMDFIKMSKDVKTKLVNCTPEDIKYVVQMYYQIQDFRINAGGKLRAIEQSKAAASKASDDGETHLDLMQWIYNNMLGIEHEIQKALDIWTDNDTVASWLKQITGIGPVISAGLVANLDITKASSVGHFYSYCGLNDNNDPWLGEKKARAIVDDVIPVKKKTLDTSDILAVAQHPDCKRSVEKLCRYAWDEKKQKYTRDALIKGLSKLQYNKDLKVLLWKAGQSFMKVSNNPKSLYGRIYKEKRASEKLKSEAGLFADQAAAGYERCKNSKNKAVLEAYKAGKLPDGHIIARSTRYACKFLVSHLFEEMWRVKYNTEAPRLYVHEYLGHVDYVEPEVPFTPLDPNKPKFKFGQTS